MKQFRLFILLTILMSIMGGKVSAHDIAVKNADGKMIFYNWNKNKTELAVTYWGEDAATVEEYKNNVIIPSTVTYNQVTYKVTSIGKQAFYKCYSLTSVSIPNSVTSIESSAFADCIELTSVLIPNSVTSIGASAFSGCSSMTSVTIGNGVTSIGPSAFRGCSNLTSVTFHCKEVDSWFSGLKKISEITIGDEVTSISDNAFKGCSGLTSVTIGKNMPSIGIGAFAGCGNLKVDIHSSSITSFSSNSGIKEIIKEVIIGDEVNSIDGRAFSNCSGLTSVTIPKSVTTIDYGAFENCNSLVSVHISDIEAWCNIEFHYYHSNPLEYAHHLFLNGEEVKDVIIPNSLKSIGNQTFCGCSCLTSVTIPNSVTSIGEGAFAGCSSLTSVTIPNKVTSIGDHSFEGCSSMTSVTIPMSVTSIGKEAFEGCSSLTSVHISDIAAWCNIEFNDYSYSSNPLRYAHHLFLNGEEVKDLIIPNNVTSIGNQTFYGCSSLTSVTIPNSVTSIGDHSFEGCSSMTSVTIPKSVTSIGNAAFWLCNSLTSVHISDIEAWCNIEFYDYSPSSNPLRYAHHLFLNGEEVKDLIIPNNVTSIGNQTFYGCSSLTSVTIPNSVTSIGRDAFKDCNGLTSVHISDMVAWCSISFVSQESNPLNCAHHLFLNDEKVQDLIIPNSITRIRDYAFNGCRVTSVTIHNSVTSIGKYAFSGYGLSYVTIRHSVGYIGESAFRGHRLIEVAIHVDSPLKIDRFTFNSEDALLCVPKWCGKKYKAADYWKDFKVISEGDMDESVYHLIYVVDGVVYKSDGIKEGKAIAPKLPIKEGYTFSAWSEIPETMPNHDVTVTGTFTKNPTAKYKLTYKVDGEVYKTCEIEEGSTITPEPAPTKEGYTFSGWSEIPKTMPNHDVTVTGTFTINSTTKYKLTYKVDGEVYKTNEIEEGATISPEPAPTKDGYTFSGWSEIPTTMPDHDVTVTGTFTKNPTAKYKLTYTVDGEEYKTCEIEEGATITPEPAPTKEGYSFSGWSEIPTTMPNHDVIVTGTFTKDPEKLDVNYVDLGLPSGLLWATCNLGADRPEQFGNYYDWVSNPVQESWDDVWRTPTKAERDELVQYCTYSLETINGVQGAKYTGSNGQSIFFPFAGYCQSGYGPYKIGVGGQYWTTTEYSSNEHWIIATNNPIQADDNGYYWPLNYFGFPVRPVTSVRPNIIDDANGDGNVDESDINAIVVYLMNGKTEGFNFNNADANGDQKVNVADIVKIINRIKK